MTTDDVRKKFDQFYADNNNKFVERVDSNALNQCFDLAIYWCEYLGLPKSIFSGLGTAKQIWIPSTTVAVQNFDYIDNTPDAIAQKGDVVVWSGNYNGGAGHVGIATGRADVNTLDVFEQNDPTGSASHVKTYNYNYILGWLRFKTQPASGNSSVDWSPLTKINGALTTPQAAADFIIALQKDITARDSSITDKDKAYAALQKQLNDEIANRNGYCQQKVNDLKQKITNLLQSYQI